MFHKIGPSFIVIFSVISCGHLKKIPDFIKVCTWDPATIDDCVRRSVESLRPNLIEGIPDLGVPSIDPFYIPELAISGPSAPLKAIGKDIKVTGAGNFSIESLSVDLDGFTTVFKVTFPKLHFVGKYKVDVQILVLPLKGEGTMTADSLKVEAELTLRSEPVHIDGKDYVKFVSLDTNINMKDYRVRLEGLFNGDKVLGEATNEAINQNKGEFLKATKPYLEKTVSKLLLDIANKVVDGLTLDQLLPKPKK